MVMTLLTLCSFKKSLCVMLMLPQCATALLPKGIVFTMFWVMRIGKGVIVVLAFGFVTLYLLALSNPGVTIMARQSLFWLMESFS